MKFIDVWTVSTDSAQKKFIHEFSAEMYAAELKDKGTETSTASAMTAVVVTMHGEVFILGDRIM